MSWAQIERTWEDLKQVIDDDRLGELGRKDEDQQSMAQHMVFVRSSYSSTKDYILSKMFDFPIEDDYDHPVDNNTQNNNNNNNQNVYKKKVVKPTDVKQKIAFKLNDFPYNCHRSITHWVLWCLQPLTHEEAKAYIISHFQNKLKHGDDFLFFINPVALQSIKEVTHYHVFLRNESVDRYHNEIKNNTNNNNNHHIVNENVNGCHQDHHHELEDNHGQIASGTSNTVPSC